MCDHLCMQRLCNCRSCTLIINCIRTILHVQRHTNTRISAHDLHRFVWVCLCRQTLLLCYQASVSSTVVAPQVIAKYVKRCHSAFQDDMVP